jgi:hypothetical protein
MDPLIALLIVVLAVLTVLLVIVGVQVIIIMREFRTTLVHLNRTLQNTDDLLTLVSKPFQGLGDTVVGIKSGMRVAELFVSWLKENQRNERRIEQ